MCFSYQLLFMTKQLTYTTWVLLKDDFEKARNHGTIVMD